MDQQYSSILLENAVNEFAKLPGIGRKTALRLVLHLLRQEEGEAEKFGNTIINFLIIIQDYYDKKCFRVSGAVCGKIAG